jgi:hypothetical protein
LDQPTPIETNFYIYICSDHFSPSTMTHKEVDILVELCSKNQLKNLEMLELLQSFLGAALVGCPAGAIVA